MARAVPFAALPDDTIDAALAHITANLRPADLDEVRASTEDDPAETVVSAAWGSELAWLILDRSGLPIGVMGVHEGGVPGVGLPWMVGTDGVEREALSIARQTRRYVAEMQEAFPVLTNFIDARNELSLTWLEWAGFSLIDADLHHGPERRLFLQFART